MQSFGNAFSKVLFVPGASISHSPARCNRRTKVLYINRDMWPGFSDNTQRFVVYHEEGHIVLNTRDEFSADEYAFQKMMNEGRSLKDCVLSLTKLLTDSTGHRHRAYLTLQRAKAFDMLQNNNSAMFLDDPLTEDFFGLGDIIGAVKKGVGAIKKLKKKKGKKGAKKSKPKKSEDNNNDNNSNGAADESNDIAAMASKAARAAVAAKSAGIPWGQIGTTFLSSGAAGLAGAGAMQDQFSPVPYATQPFVNSAPPAIGTPQYNNYSAMRPAAYDNPSKPEDKKNNTMLMAIIGVVIFIVILMVVLMAAKK